MKFLKPLIFSLTLCAGALSAFQPTRPIVAMAPQAPKVQEVAAAASDVTAPSLPADTFIVARLKGIDALDRALAALKDWVQVHPSVQALFDEEWDKVEQFDLRRAAADYLDLSPEDFNKYFDGAITLYMSGDFKTAKETKMLPVTIEFTTSSPDSAKDFVELLKSEDDVMETAEAAEGVTRIRMDSSVIDDGEDGQQGAAAAKNKKSEDADTPMDVYVALSNENVIIGNSLDYTIATLKAHQPDAGGAGSAAANVFWQRVGGNDAAMWIDPQPFFEMVKEKMEGKAKDNEEKKARTDEIIAGLGLNEIEGVGLYGNLTPLEVHMELQYTTPPMGIAKILTCTPTGLEATPLIPAEVNEFSMGRMDVNCLWSEVRRMAKIVMPATETIYDGWKKQLQENFKVDFEKQLIGAVGTNYVVYSRDSIHEPLNSSIYISLNDSQGFQSALDAFFGFFTQGKDLFDHEKIGTVPVWRLKSEFQSPNAPPIAYAITPQWLIVSIGDPTQLQDLIENAGSHTVTSKILTSPALKEVLASPSLIGVSHRPLKVVLTDVAAAMIKIKHRQEAADNGVSAQKEDSPDADYPTFDDVNENVLMTTESKPGNVQTTLKIIPADEQSN